MSYTFLKLDNNTDPTFNQLLGINNAGTIAGYFGNGTNRANKGYTVTPPYAQSNFINENFPNSVQTQVTGLNDLGLTVGFWADALPGTNNFGFVDNAGTFTSVTGPDAAGVTPSVTQLLGVNNEDTAVGFDVGADGVTRGFTYNIANNTFATLLEPPHTVNLTATGINNENQISGFLTTTGGAEDGFVETSPGTFTMLTGPQTGDTNIMALGLNDEGQAVGSFVGTDGNTHGFVFNIASKTYTTIDQGNNTATVVNGINDLGQIVGFDQNASAPGTDGSHTDGFLASIPGTIANIGNPTAGITIEVPAGFGGVMLGGTNDVTLQDFLAGKALLQANQGNDLLISAVGADTLVGGAGADTLNGAAGTNTTFRDGGGNASMVGGNGNDIFIGTTGNDTITTGTGSNLVVPGSGKDQINAHGASDVIFPGGSDTVFAFGKVLTAVGTGQLVFLNGANQATVLGGGSGSALINGGPGGGLFAGGTGGLNVIFGGTGASTIFGSSGSDLLVAGGSNADFLIAGSGNETLTGLGSTGNNIFYAGAGNDLLGGGSGNETFFGSHGNSTVIGGSGADLYAFVNNVFAGGNETIFGFNTGKGDLIALQGYGANEAQNDLANQKNVGGSTVLTLSDHTQITFVGVSSLNINAFT